MQSKQTLLGLLGVSVVSVAVLPFLLGADNSQSAMRRQSLAMMSRTQRQRLQRNFDRYTAMNAGQQQKLRDFHAALEADRTTGRGRLNKTLQIYDQWLQTLSPHQRYVLRKESDPSRRIALVREIVQQQRADRVALRMGPRDESLGSIPLISREDLDAMLEVIDGKLGLYLSNRQELEGYEGIRRRLKMFELLARQRRTIGDLLSPANTRQLLEAISDDSTREQLQTLPDVDRPNGEAQSRRIKLGLAIHQAMETEFDRKLRSRSVSPENVNRSFENLSREVQDELLSRTPGQFRQELTHRSAEEEWAQDGIDMEQVRQFFRP